MLGIRTKIGAGYWTLTSLHGGLNARRVFEGPAGNYFARIFAAHRNNDVSNITSGERFLSFCYWILRNQRIKDVPGRRVHS